MNPLDVFVDTVGCYDGACEAVAGPEFWFLGLLAVCLVALWEGARATTAMVSTPPITAAGTQLLGRRYGTALTGLLFVLWFLTAFGLSVPALGTVQNPLAWTVMVPLHVTLLLSGLLLGAGYALFAAASLRRPGRFRPGSRRKRAALALVAVALPAGWGLAGRRAPHLVDEPTATASGWLSDALGVGLLDRWIGGLWWLAEGLSSPIPLAAVAAAAACYVLLPRGEDPGSCPSVARQRTRVVSSGSYRRGTGSPQVRPTRVVAPARVPGRGGDPSGAAAQASTLAVGASVAVTGGAAAVAALTAGLGAMPAQGPAVVLAVLAGYLVLGSALRTR